MRKPELARRKKGEIIEPSLEQLRRTVQERKTGGETVQSTQILEPEFDIAVDPDGKIIVVEITPTGAIAASRAVSQVPKDTFAEVTIRFQKGKQHLITVYK